MKTEKKCSKCGVTKPLTDFSPKKTTKDGLNPYCKPCRNARDQYARDRKRGTPLKSYRVDTLPAEDLPLVKALLADGMPPKVVASKFGVKRSAVSAVVREMGGVA